MKRVWLAGVPTKISMRIALIAMLSLGLVACGDDDTDGADTAIAAECGEATCAPDEYCCDAACGLCVENEVACNMTCDE